MVQGSRTYVPVIPEHEWYRAEAEQVEVFAPLVPVERVWVETVGARPSAVDPTHDKGIRLVSLDGPTHPAPTPVFETDAVSGRRVVHVEDSVEHRDLRAVTEILLRRRRRHLRPGDSGVGVVPLGLAWAAAHHPGGPGPPTMDRMRTSGSSAAPQTRQPSPIIGYLEAPVLPAAAPLLTVGSSPQIVKVVVTDSPADVSSLRQRTPNRLSTTTL